MSGASLDLSSLSLLVLVVVISCCVATLLSWWWMRSMSPRTYQYCASCAHQLGVLPPEPCAVLTDGVVARPWLGCAQAGQAGAQAQAGTFQRLGMKTVRPGIGLEAGYLETRPLSPVPGEEEGRDCVENGGEKRKSVKQQMSPASAEVLARRDTMRGFGAGSRMSRRTLVFPTQSQLSLSTGGGWKEEEKSSSFNSPSNTVVGAEEEEEVSQDRMEKDIKQRQVRRSVSARKEKSKLSLLRRQEDAGLTSQSEDERGAAGLRQFRRHFAGGREKEVVGGGPVNKLEVTSGGFDNPGYEATDTEHLSPRPGYQNLPTIQFSPRVHGPAG